MKIESAAKRILNSKSFCRPVLFRAAKSLCHQERGPRFWHCLVDFFHMFLGSCRSHMFTMLTLHNVAKAAMEFAQRTQRAQRAQRAQRFAIGTSDPI